MMKWSHFQTQFKIQFKTQFKIQSQSQIQFKTQFKIQFQSQSQFQFQPSLHVTFLKKQNQHGVRNLNTLSPMHRRSQELENKCLTLFEESCGL